MTVKFLVNMLTKETLVIIKDYQTNKTLYKGYAGNIDFNDKIKDWDFSNDHIIYI